MKLRPKLKGKTMKTHSLHCGICGSKVPFNKKYLNRFCQQKLRGAERWIVYIGFTCPNCLMITDIILHYSKSLSETMKRINLYTNTRKK